MSSDSSIQKPPSLAVIGVYNACEAYPNTLYALCGLRRDFNVKEINVKLLPKEGGAIRVFGTGLSKVWKIVSAHIRVIAKAFVLRPRPAYVFVPYPAPILLCIWSFVPGAFRSKRIVADAFISLYDTVVNDRGLLRAADWRAKLLWYIERRAYGFADAVVVDTPQNADFYASLFRLPKELFVPVPLATNEHDFKLAPPFTDCNICEVLFIGTLIPLHGISVIVDAARLLEDYKTIRFTIVGSGQQAEILESAKRAGATNIVWERDWKTSAELATYIAKADICLGIFGSGLKAQRVCPYKIYAYASMGKAIVTAQTTWLERAAEDFGEMPFVSVPVADAPALAAEIVCLANNTTLRHEMADRAHRFYESKLANRIAAERLRASILGKVAL
jgi:glycosyltransferase involved in cell wall biosynthesis